MRLTPASATPDRPSFEQPLGGPAEPIQSPEHDLLDLAAPHISQEPIQGGALHHRACELVLVPRHGFGLSLGPGLQVGFLALRILAVAADPQVDRCLS